jgi:phage antirepressor YoqD-like protein
MDHQEYLQRILESKSLVTITQIAKDYGMSGQTMNDLLHKMRVQYQQDGQWMLYSKYHSRGYTHSKTLLVPRSDGSDDVKMHTRWTQKGRVFIYKLLKKNGIVPVIERS